MGKNSIAFTFLHFSQFHKNETLSWISYMNKWCVLLKENMSKIDIFQKFQNLNVHDAKTGLQLFNSSSHFDVCLQQTSEVSLK